MSARQALKVLSGESGIAAGTLKSWLYSESYERHNQKRKETESSEIRTFISTEEDTKKEYNIEKSAHIHVAQNSGENEWYTPTEKQKNALGIESTQFNEQDTLVTEEKYNTEYQHVLTI